MLEEYKARALDEDAASKAREIQASDAEATRVSTKSAFPHDLSSNRMKAMAEAGFPDDYPAPDVFYRKSLVCLNLICI